jgi:lipopolysaccharide export system protein LptA
MFMLMLTGTLANAQETTAGDPIATPEPPIHIKADKLITDTQKNTAEFSGNVQATQGDAVITADLLTVHYRSGAQTDTTSGMDAIVRIVAEGNVQIEFDQQTAYTQHADYIAEKRLMVLTGPGSKIVSGKNAITGQKITLNRDDGRVQVVGSADAPVEAFFYSNETGLATPDKPDPN